MNWMPKWLQSLLALLLVALEAYRWGFGTAPGVVRAGWSTDRKLEVRGKVRDLFYHGYDNYMQHAFPMDELAPLSCGGHGPDWHMPDNIAYNDVAGNFSLTLVDTLDTLVILNDRPGFEDAVRKTIKHVSFDVNTKPQLFETNIRVLGGLLSAHIYANQTGQPFFLPWYRGELLALARDLGNRFLPAFTTPTGIPFARVNLRHGIPKGESIESCTAGAGSLILEFATLSRLTGDTRFEKAAHKAFFAIWNRKSDVGLVGNQINLWNGNWIYPELSSVGAGIDSFFEYALKWYILSGEHEFLDVWNESYASIMRFSRSQDGFWYRRVNMHTGDLAYYTLDSLSAFWPGLQVLAGDLENAIKSHMLYWNLWQRHSGLPEVWDMNFKQATSLQYPLRPEFVESTWYLYRATRDSLYLDVGERILHDITLRSKVSCGLAGIADLKTNKRDDRMESFVLSETLKYLYLLFDEENPLHSDDSNWVLTTEGHILRLDSSLIKPPSSVVRQLRRAESPQCPAYDPPDFGNDYMRGLTVGIRSRSDFDYASQLVGNPLALSEGAFWHESGVCELPKVDLFMYEFLMSVDGGKIVEDVKPGPKKIMVVPDGFMVQDVEGIRARVSSRLDGRGYDIVKLGPHTVRTGQNVYINDSGLALGSTDTMQAATDEHRHPDISIRFFIDFVDLQVPVGEELATDGVELIRDPSNALGCAPYTREYQGEALLVQRGECAFLEKLQWAHRAGASGVVVISDEDLAINPSVEPEELVEIGDTLDDAVMLVLRHSEGQIVSAMLDAAEAQRLGRLVLILEGRHASGSGTAGGTMQSRRRETDVHRVLHINGHPLLNTRLIV
ncbi:alpha-mannosidase [Amylostereum chailletii]|nr:alpha-mannosidase [Amylostereum chailletii]